MLTRSRLMLLGTIAAFLGALALTVILYFQHKLSIIIWHNADSLSLPTIVKDVFFGEGYYRDWNANPAPDFVPDWPLYALANLINPDIYFGWVWFFSLQSILTVVAGAILLAHFMNLRNAIAWALVANSWHLLFSAFSLQPFLLTIIGGFHFNIFILLLFWLAAVISLVFRRRFRWTDLPSVSVFALTAVSVVGDRLFVIHAVLPLLVVTFGVRRWNTLDKIHLQRLMRASALAIAGTFAGMIAALLLIARPHSYAYNLKPRDLFVNIGKVGVSFYEIITGTPAGFFCIVLIVLFVLNAQKVIRDSKVASPSTLTKIQLLNYICLSSFLVTLAVLCLGNTGFVARYAMQIYLLPIFLMPLILKPDWKMLRGSGRRTAAFLILILVPLISLAAKALSGDRSLKSSYYPSEYECIDGLAKEHNLRYGLAQYWMTKPLRLLSKQNLEIAPYAMGEGRLVFFNWSGKVNWEQPSYDFAIISTAEVPGSYYLLDENQIIEASGEPKRVEFCGKEKILIYGNRGLKVPASK
jgi:hypothetical protein